MYRSIKILRLLTSSLNFNKTAAEIFSSSVFNWDPKFLPYILNFGLNFVANLAANSMGRGWKYWGLTEEPLCKMAQLKGVSENHNNVQCQIMGKSGRVTSYLEVNIYLINKLHLDIYIIITSDTGWSMTTNLIQIVTKYYGQTKYRVPLKWCKF